MKSPIFLIIIIGYYLTTRALHTEEIQSNHKNWQENIEILLSNHPEIRSLDEGVKSLYWNTETKDILPDTKIGLAYRSYPARRGNPLQPDMGNRDDTPGMTGREISISQEIPYLEKLQSDKKLSYWNFRSEKERVILAKNQFLKNFFLLSIEKNILNQEKADWNQVQKVQSSLSRISNAGFTSGRDNAFSALRDRNDNTKIKDKIIDINTRLEEVEESLEYFLSAFNENQKEKFTSSLPALHTMLDTKYQDFIQLLQSNPSQLSANNPNSKLYETNIQLAKESERRDNLNYLPDAEIFLAYMQRNSRLFRVSQNPINFGNVMATEEFTGDLVSFGVTLKVPTWSWSAKKDLNRKNQAEKNKSIQSREAIQRQILSEMRRLVSSINGLETRIKYYENELLPTLMKSSRIQSAGSSASNDSSAILRLKLEYNISLAEKNDLLRKKQIAIIELLELSDALL
jgi:hypothetical protein